MAWGVADLGKGVAPPPCHGVRLRRPQSSHGAEDHGAGGRPVTRGAWWVLGGPQQSGHTFPEAQAAQTRVNKTQTEKTSLLPERGAPRNLRPREQGSSSLAETKRQL